MILPICQNNTVPFIQEWLDRHGPYDFVVDGANVGLYQQNFADGGFSVSQVSEKGVCLSIFIFALHFAGLYVI
jgi:proteinaceous RNase P